MKTKRKGWFLVEESKPPRLLDVLVYFGGGIATRRSFAVGYYWGDDGEYAGQWGPKEARKYKITHWAFLPKRPH